MIEFKNIIKIDSSSDLNDILTDKILYVEDSYAETLLFDNIIHKYDENLECFWVNDTSLFLDLIEKGLLSNLKLILLDIKMPVINGIECLEIIRKKYPDFIIPIVMLSSSDHNADVVKAYKLYCNAYITKVNNLSTFRQKINETFDFWLKTNNTNF